MDVGFLGNVSAVGVTPDFTDDFTTYANQAAADAVWPTSDVKARVNVTTDELTFDFERGGGNASCVHSFAGVSDTAWVLRSSWDISAIATPSSVDCFGFYGMMSADEGTGGASAQDALLILLEADPGGTHKYFTKEADGEELTAGNETIFTRNLAVEAVFLEQIRTSATAFSCEFFSDSAYSSSLEAQTVVTASTVIDLDFIKGTNRNQAGPTGSTDLEIALVQFWNNVTSV